MAYLLSGNAHTAEELVQEALVRVAVRWRKVAAAGDPEAYVRGIIVNQHISRWRRTGRQELIVADPPEQAVSDQSENSARRMDIMTALDTLSPRQRSVLLLRFYLDLSEAEIAQTLGCSVGNVKRHASDALRRLREVAPRLFDTERQIVR
jgi:RNA polymerase sigma-70 factor (sigma-E family)